MYSGGVNRQEAQQVHGWESSQIGFLLKPYDAIRTRLARSPEAGAAAGFSVIFLVFALATPDTFLSHSTISSILNSQAVPGILAIGITLLMISGEFDLSVGSILGVSSLAFLYATVNGVPILLAAAIGLVIGCLLGLINGLLLISTGTDAAAALGEIGIHIRNARESVGSLSGGERQSIAIARALHFGSRVLILDEPTSALSVGETRKVLSYITAAKKKGIGVIFITHNISHVFEVADRATILSHGEKVGDFSICDVTQDDIAAMVMGQGIPEHLLISCPNHSKRQ